MVTQTLARGVHMRLGHRSWRHGTAAGPVGGDAWCWQRPALQTIIRNPSHSLHACQTTKTRRRLPPLDLLAGFEAAARRLSFTLAAEERFITQSAISRQVKALEDDLGVPLFVRGHRSLRSPPTASACTAAAARCWSSCARP
jgi:hypothetical protein